MSSMLEEAIIDAEALKEAAKKSAEEKIIEHFSKDIKEAVDLILEQDPTMDPTMAPAPGLGASMAPTDPFAAEPTMPGTAVPDPGLIDIESDTQVTDATKFVVDQAPYAATTSDKDFVSIDLNRLEEAMGGILQETGPEWEAGRAECDRLGGGEAAVKDCKGECGEQAFEEATSFDIDENLLLEDDDILEESGAVCDDDDDEGADEDDDEPAPGKRNPRDNMGGGHGDYKTAAEFPNYPYKESVERIVEDLEDDETLEEMIRNILAEDSEELEDVKLEEARAPQRRPKTAAPTKKNAKLLKEHKQLNEKVKLLEQKLNKYQEVFPQLKHQLEESNLHNARLHYQNRVLNSDSLNERQKDRLVETISKAKTVEEAKIIYETLQSAVGASAFKHKPKSLNEVVTKRSSAFMPRKEEKRGDPLAARMKALAGITDK